MAKPIIKEQPNRVSGIKIVTAAVIICLLTAMALETPETIGESGMYTFFILILPVLAGILIASRFLNIKHLDSIGHKITYLFISVIVSYLTLGLMTSVIFDSVNYNASRKNKPLIITVPITEFKAYDRNKNASYQIKFEFEGEEEHVETDKKSLERFELENFYNIQLKLRPGIWNRYLVEEWKIVQ